jgi:outer membrane protein TolC
MNVESTRAAKRRAYTGALYVLLAVMPFVPALAGAQQSAGARPLSLDEAIRIAARESEQLQIARAGISRASGGVKQARSQYLPQVNAQLIYARTLRSQFSALASGGGSDSTPTTPAAQAVCAPSIPANATPAERQAALAQASTCVAAAGIDFSKVGFGARNAYTAGLAISQNVYTGGRVAGQTASANAQQRSAEIELTSQRAQLALDVTQAYFDAVLADRLVVIADTALAQTEELLRQTRVGRQVGNQSEFELLRATVSRDNQRPTLIARQGDRDVAYVRLKQLLNLPLDAPLQLTTPIDEPSALTQIIASAATADSSVVSSDTTTARRAPVRESEQALLAQEAQLKVARSDRLPTFTLNSNYQRLFFPVDFFPSINQFSQNWTIGGTIGMSLFSGGRVTGEIEVAQANLDEARARLQQAKELAALDTRVAFVQLQSAEAAFLASRGTAQQAARAYNIDELRYREGLSTQTDLTQSRLQLEQANANQALSARDFAVARARVALLRDLPINSAALGASAQRAAAAAQQQPQQPQQQQRTQSTAAGATGAGPIGSPTP